MQFQGESILTAEKLVKSRFKGKHSNLWHADKNLFKGGSIQTAEILVKNNFKKSIPIPEMLVEKQCQGRNILTAEMLVKNNLTRKHSNCWKAGWKKIKGEAF